MNDEPRLKGQQHAFSRSDVIVSLKHLSRVREALDEFASPQREDDVDIDLGMARLRIPRLEAAQARFGKYDKGARGEAAGSNREDRDAVLLDSLLRGLRGYFRKEYAGWAPLIGKNRLVGSVVGGGGKVSHGGGGPLLKADQGERLADRANGEPETWRALGAGARVAVLDTALSPNDWYAGAWTAPAGDVLPLSKGKPLPPEAGHGTFVAGLILEQAPACTIISRRVLDTNGEADVWDVARSIVRLARTRPDVMNLSFLCFTEDGEAPLALAAAIDRVDPETVIVAAAGNHGDLPDEEVEADVKGDVEDDAKRSVLEPGRKPAWPAALDRVVAVGSSNFDGDRSPFTPRNVDWIDAYAPGEGLVSTYLHHEIDPSGVETRSERSDQGGAYNGLARWTGSSFSAASVSGAIAARVEPGRKSAERAWDDLAGDQAERLKRRPGQPVFIGPKELRYSWRRDGADPKTAS